MRRSRANCCANTPGITKIYSPGISTMELDEIAEAFIISQDAIPSFKGYNGFPGSICTTVNEVLVHGIPGDRVLMKAI